MFAKLRSRLERISKEQLSHWLTAQVPLKRLYQMGRMAAVG
jgi:hypothetical protein